MVASTMRPAGAGRNQRRIQLESEWVVDPMRGDISGNHTLSVQSAVRKHFGGGDIMAPAITQTAPFTVLPDNFLTYLADRRRS
jgi:hypothetical protein